MFFCLFSVCFFFVDLLEVIVSYNNFATQLSQTFSHFEL